MSQYHYGMKKVPKPIGSAEWESFKKFAKNHYRDAVEIARAIIDGDLTHPLNQLIFKQILDKAASPLVYIWEEWQLLGSEDRLKYATEDYRKQLEAQIKVGMDKCEDLTGAQLGMLKAFLEQRAEDEIERLLEQIESKQFLFSIPCFGEVVFSQEEIRQIIKKIKKGE